MQETWEMWAQSLGQEHPMEEGMATHSSILASRIPWTEALGRLQSMGSQRVGHDWATSLSLFIFMHWRRKWQPTPVFLPGESHGQRRLAGYSPWGRKELDMTERLSTCSSMFTWKVLVCVFVSVLFILGPRKLDDTEKLFPRALPQENRGLRTPLCKESTFHASYHPATLGRSTWVASRKCMEKSDAECFTSEMKF